MPSAAAEQGKRSFGRRNPIDCCPETQTINANHPVETQMNDRSGHISIEDKGRRIEGTYVVFGRRVTVEAGGHTKTAQDPGSAEAAKVLAKILLLEMADEGLI